MIKGFSLCFALVSALGFVASQAWVLCFENTTYGGFVPFLSISVIGPLTMLAIGYIIRAEE